MTLQFYFRFTDCPYPLTHTPTSVYNEETSLGDTMTKTCREEVSLGTQPKIKAAKCRCMLQKEFQIDTCQEEEWQGAAVVSVEWSVVWQGSAASPTPSGFGWLLGDVQVAEESHEPRLFSSTGGCQIHNLMWRLRLASGSECQWAFSGEVFPRKLTT